jgi:hypothetical protein
MPDLPVEVVAARSLSQLRRPSLADLSRHPAGRRAGCWRRGALAIGAG